VRACVRAVSPHDQSSMTSAHANQSRQSGETDTASYSPQHPLAPIHSSAHPTAILITALGASQQTCHPSTPFPRCHGVISGACWEIQYKLLFRPGKMWVFCNERWR